VQRKGLAPMQPKPASQLTRIPGLAKLLDDGNDPGTFLRNR
jgi:hypothetical protein